MNIKFSKILVLTLCLLIAFANFSIVISFSNPNDISNQIYELEKEYLRQIDLAIYYNNLAESNYRVARDVSQEIKLDSQHALDAIIGGEHQIYAFFVIDALRKVPKNIYMSWREKYYSGRALRCAYNAQRIGRKIEELQKKLNSY